MKEIPFERIVNYFEKHNWDIMQLPQRDDKPVLISDWNKVHKSMMNYLENFYELAFDEEATSCSDCGYYIDLSPSYHGSPDHFYTDCEVICRECFEANPEAYLGSKTFWLEDKVYQHTAMPEWARSHIEHAGYFPLYTDDSICHTVFESGLHVGQNDTPEKVVKIALELLGNKEAIFVIDSANPFSVYFSLYIKKE